MPLLLDETAILEWALYLLAAAGGLALLLGAVLWVALRSALKKQAAGAATATSRPGCLAALVVAAVLGLLLLQLLL